jgi:copper homeostasis protein
MPLTFEICVEGIDGMLAAQEGGGDRVELCASLLEGGLTPSLGVVREALRLAKVPLMVMVRPRGGDFLYSAVEFASMREDVAALRDLGVAGVVFGCLLPDGRIDAARTRALVEAARPLSVTVHSAFDMVADPDAALETLIECGVDRVLTSGLQPDGVAGAAMLARLHQRAAGRIIILGCGALRPETIGQVRAQTGLTELHFSAPRRVPSGMTYRNPAIGMGGTELDREYWQDVTDPERVRATIAAARA